jgi:hypothetical protein
MKTRLENGEFGLSKGCSVGVRWWSVFTLAAFLGLAGIVHAFDITGRYSDKGTAVSTNETHLEGDVSLHALLCLDFNPKSNAYASSDEIKLTQERGSLEAEVLNEDDKVMLKTHWVLDREFTLEDNRLVLTLRANASSQVGYALLFESAAEGKLLEVTVVRISATSLGPVTQRMGTYFFPRMK